MTDPLLQIKHLEKSYGEERVLEDVSFEMAERDAYVLIGPSGSGKSTLLRCVTD